jgi:NMD protein affecting ribosome stability and mRNA decay
MDEAAHVTDRDRSAFISNVEEIDNGYDLYLSNRKMARALLDHLKEQFNVDEQRSKELVGESDGEKQYRTVISARVGDQLHS